MKHPSRILLEPVVTEKSTLLKDENNLLCFRVARGATKPEIRRAVEAVFQVKVETVRTVNVRGKPKRWGRSSGRRPDWKKAWVKLRPGEKMIQYFEGT
ncbi:MAG: 50S ribosomal protein L23 [Acidobacteria bacterium]|nr:50S ribosomal protein L23 [Acidobacteriota bacterium]